MPLYMILLGCRPGGRYTEQHDVFFCIADSLEAAKPAMQAFWPGSGKLHIDAWRTVTSVDGFTIELKERASEEQAEQEFKLYFVNLGGYKPGVFEEFHYKMLVVARDKAGAIAAAKKTAFYQHTGFKGADSHIDDKYGIDVDDIEAIEDILPAADRERFTIRIHKASHMEEDAMHLGYLKWSGIGAAE